jgi:heterodisulfide reductase subunit A
VVEFSGQMGDFNVKVHRKARYVDSSRCTACGACAEKCPTKVPNEFNFGLDERKAIYKDYAQGIPSVYTIDPDACTGCQACARNCPVGAITGEKKKAHVLDQNKCVKCGACRESCKFNAVIIVSGKGAV